MIYPYCLYDENITLAPIFPEIGGSPYFLDLSPGSPIHNHIDSNNQLALQHYLDEQMGGKYSWGIGAYLENREKTLLKYPQMVSEQRFFHLGIDIVVPLGAKLHAPLNSVVEQSGYEQGDGNYGGYVLLKHQYPSHEPFYSFYGHLCRSTLPDKGSAYPAGSPFAEIGDFSENGNWFYHTHIQILTQKGYTLGYLSKGYCTKNTLDEIHTICPSPIPLFACG